MNNRFGFKELVLATLVVIVMVMVGLAMWQVDRQWELVQAIERQSSQQTRELSEIRRLLSGGISSVMTPATTTTGATTAPALPDAFSRLREVHGRADFATGDWIIDAFGANVAKITPLVVVDVYGSRIGSHVLESLATRDPATLDWVPLLAQSWKVQDNSKAWQEYVDARLPQPLTPQEVKTETGYVESPPEKQEQYLAERMVQGRRQSDIVNEKMCPPATVIEFTIRPGITFSDGQPLTAEDVVFTYDLILNKAIDAPRVRDTFEDKVRSVVATGSHQVVFTFKEPYFESFGLAASMDVQPKHFYSQYTPQEYNRRPGLLMGSGPYRMESPTDWAPGKLLALVRNERYWGVPPAFDRIIYHEVSNEVARLTMYRNGEIDFFPAQPEQYVKLLQDKELLARSQRFEYEAITGGYGFIAWNQRRAGKPTAFADQRVRQAMTMMINTQRLFDEILLGYGIPVTGPFNRLSKQSDNSLQPWPYDVKRARKLLLEAGFTVGGDGVIRGPDGQPFRFAVTFPSGTGFWDRVLLLLKDSLAEAGVIMELDPLEWAVFDERVKTRNFDALCMAWSGGIESDIRQMFHSSQTAGGADNFVSYTNLELDKLINQARREVDESRRMPLWQACHRILFEDQPYTFLYTRRSTTLIDQRIKNVEQLKVGLNDRTEWYVPKPAQKWPR